MGEQSSGETVNIIKIGTGISHKTESLAQKNTKGTSLINYAEGVYLGHVDNYSGPRPPQSEQEKQLIKNATVTSSDIADFYLLSGISFRSQLIEGLGAHADDETALKFETSFRLKEIAQKHVLSSIMMLAFNTSYRSTEGFQEFIGELTNTNNSESLFTSGNTTQILAQLDALKKNGSFTDPTYVAILERTKTLNKDTIALTKNTRLSSDKDILKSITLFHNTLHHIGGFVMEKVMAPGEAKKAYELLLRFSSSDKDLVYQSLMKYSSPEAKKIMIEGHRFGWYSILGFDFSTLFPPRVPQYTQTQEAYKLLGEVLVESDRERTIIDPHVQNYRNDVLIKLIPYMSDYPIFKDLAPIVDKLDSSHLLLVKDWLTNIKANYDSKKTPQKNISSALNSSLRKKEFVTLFLSKAEHFKGLYVENKDTLVGLVINMRTFLNNSSVDIRTEDKLSWTKKFFSTFSDVLLSDNKSNEYEQTIEFLFDLFDLFKEEKGLLDNEKNQFLTLFSEDKIYYKLPLFIISSDMKDSDVLSQEEKRMYQRIFERRRWNKARSISANKI